jgi:two-component system OmpR family sensor kinase
VNLLPRRVVDGPGTDPETRALNQSRRSITVRIAVAMTTMLLLVGAVVFLVMLAAQRGDVDRDLSWAVTRSAVDSPPGCTYLVVVNGNGVARSPGTPAGFPLAADLAAVRGGHAPIQRDVKADDSTYEVLTTTRGDDVLQGVYDLRFQMEDRESLLLAIGVAELAGIVGAAVFGGLLARRAMAPLCEAMERQRRFVADASHELRTPLTRLHTRAQLLVRRADALSLPDRVITDLRLLVRGSRQLGDVIDDLLLSARLRTMPRPTAPVDLSVLAEEVCRDEQVRTYLAGLNMVVHRDHGPWLVIGIESALRRVVSALVDNAIGHTPPGGTITLTVGAARGAAVRLSVRDTGVGFEQSDADRIFERFARGEAGRGRRFGIGLALVREVVDSHGGSITADSGSGEGAVFTLLLPAQPSGHVLPSPRRSTEQDPVRVPAHPD